jgi:hypothetical protein
MTEIRLFPSDIGSVIPAVDIADQIGYDRTSITKVIGRHKAMFDGLTTFQRIDTASRGRQQTLCLTKTGVERVLLLIIPSRESKPDLFNRIEAFKQKFFEKVQQTSPVVQTLPASLDAELTEAIHIAEVCKKSPDPFLSAVLEKYGKKHLAVKLETPALAVVHGEPGWFNVSQLVAMCNDPLLNAERLNNYLQNNPRDPERRPFQYRDMNKLWRLTPLGWEHGEEYLYTCPSKHQEIRIRWRESILYAAGLKSQIASDQLALPVKARA